ncbi:hypothetical protein AAFN85_01590 [Mucilaginibacter sp. CAU 1740]|uniref:hypothetical protein n=1 Tax=Mucilaginibacter sp. CAU 1740 TaxID=3140365 RepID=UPI00325A6845
MLITIKKLTKNIVFKFGEKLFIEIRDIKTNKLREQYLFFYTDISSCELSSGSAKTCTFILNFKNRKKLKLILFSDEGGFTTAKTITGVQIYEKLHSLNAGIIPAKPLLMKGFGSAIIISVIVLLIVNVLVHLLYDGNDHTSLLIGLPTSASLILGTLSVRKKQLDLYNEMTALKDAANQKMI